LLGLTLILTPGYPQKKGPARKIHRDTSKSPACRSLLASERPATPAGRIPERFFVLRPEGLWYPAGWLKSHPFAGMARSHKQKKPGAKAGLFGDCGRREA